MIGQQQNIDSKVNVIIDRDYLKAYIEISPPIGTGKFCTLEMVKKALDEKKIIFGIKDDYIKDALEPKNWGYKMLIAEGQAPVNGKDARVVYRFPLPSERVCPKIDDKGKADYHNLGLIHNVKMGELLVEKIPADDGLPGIDVMGNQIPAKKGKDIGLPRGSNTVADLNGLNLYAASDGHVALLNNKVTVNPVLVINGDVDFSTGNIDFVGSILIYGNINAGFKVKSGGDIEVCGFIEAAQLDAAGSIMVKGGIKRCMKTIVKAQENIFSLFVENSKLEAGRDVLVREAIMQSHVKAGGNVKVTDSKALIVGGLIQAGRDLEAKVIGSPLATQTRIEVGINPYLRDEYQKLNWTKGQKKKIFNDLNYNIQLFQKNGIPVEKLSEKKKLDLIKMLEQFKNLRHDFEEIDKKMVLLEKEMQKNYTSRVRVLGIVYPGVHISIGQSIYIVNDPIRLSQFILDHGEVRLTSLN
ncbi:MAG: DUF342 domain-containing protein [Syntrophomonadaceae bacterium]|jgi:uncharacterized protein (DUF342 family)